MEPQITTDEVKPQAVDWSNTSWFRILLAAGLVLGVFFRLSRLGNKMYSHDEVYTSLHAAGYRGGEVYTELWDGDDKSMGDLREFLKPNVEKGVLDTLSVLALHQPHEAPIHFLLSHYWMRFVGYMPAAMRLLSAILGILSIPAMYWFSNELFQSRRTALLSTAVFSLSPYHIHFSQDARHYAILTLFTMLSSAALLMAIRKNGAKTWMTYSLTLIIGMYSNLLFALVAIAHGLYYLRLQVPNHNKTFGGFLSAGMFALLAYIPWLFMLATRWQRAAASMEWVTYRPPWPQYVQRWILLFSAPFVDFDFNSNLNNLLPYVLRTLILILLVYALLFLLKHGPQGEKAFLPLIYVTSMGAFMVLDIILGGIRSIAGRYFVPANIASILVMAYFLAGKLDSANPTVRTKWQYLTGMLVIFSILSNLNGLKAETWWDKELGRVRMELVHEINKDRTLLIVTGFSPTQLGDILLLGFEVDKDVHIRLYEDPASIDLSGDFENIYWFAATSNDIMNKDLNGQYEAKEVLQGTLWEIVEE